MEPTCCVLPTQVCTGVKVSIGLTGCPNLPDSYSTGPMLSVLVNRVSSKSGISFCSVEAVAYPIIVFALGP